MRVRLLRRFLAVGLIATAVDIAVFSLLQRSLPLAVADIVGLVAAGIVSFTLHRWFTLRNDPYVRWVKVPALFFPVVVTAGIIDLSLLLALNAGGLHAIGAKLVAVGFTAFVRIALHRMVLFRVVRREQDAPANRRAPLGDYRVTVVIPAYREAGRIAGTIERLRAEQPHIAPAELEIVVVDDGSADATADEARRAGADQVLVQPQNRGKGAAVRAGMLAARGRTVVFTDADLAYAPAQIIELVTRIERGWDVVVGNRRHAATATLVRLGFVRELGSRLINFATHALLLGQYRDTQCGLKAFRGDVARLIFADTTIDGFAFDCEVLHLVEHHRLSLAEVPVRVENSERSTVKVVRDGIRLIADIVRIRWRALQGRYKSEVHELPARDTAAAGTGAGEQ